MWLHKESGIISSISARQRRIIVPTCRQSHCKPGVVVAMPPPPSIDSWGTHRNEVVHICAESWDCPSCEYGAKLNISRNDTSRRIATSFTAYGVKRHRSALCQWWEFFLYTLYTRGAQPVDRELPVDRQGLDSRSRDDCRKKVYIVKYTTNSLLHPQDVRRIGRPPEAGKCKSRSHVKKGWAPLLYTLR